MSCPFKIGQKVRLKKYEDTLSEYYIAEGKPVPQDIVLLEAGATAEVTEIIDRTRRSTHLVTGKPVEFGDWEINVIVDGHTSDTGYWYIWLEAV